MPYWKKMTVAEVQHMYDGLGYEIEEEIGSGGFKQVFRAMYKGQLVAFKVMHLEGSDLDIRARREAKLMTEIQSPFVAKIIDFNFGSKDYEAFIAEEYISDVPLSTRLTQSKLTGGEIIQITDNIFQALLECASRRIVHRDVKPNNILLRQNGDAVLTDFGLARPQDESTMTPWGIEIGTYPFAPPEFIRYDSQLIDQTSDVFSLGIIIYIILTGEHPFINFENATTKEEKIREMLEATAKPPHEIDSSINVNLSKFVMKLIERQRANRYPTTERAYQRFKKISEELE